MNYNTIVYNINFELDIYKAIMKCPFKINNKQVNLASLNKLEHNYLINKNERVYFNNNFDYKKIITKSIYDEKSQYEKEIENKY